MKANPNLSSMAGFVSGTTQAALSNPGLAAFTVFAPTNDAFNKMLNVKIPGVDVRSFMNNRAILQMVMNIHLVPGTWTTAKMTNGQKMQSRLSGASGALTVKKDGGGVFIQSAGATAKVVQRDIMAGQNGVMQVVDSMLLPVKLSSALQAAAPQRTLVLYHLHAPGDAAALENLHHFVAAAVASAAPPPGAVRYAVLLPAGGGSGPGGAEGSGGGGGAAAAWDLPALPPAAGAAYVEGAPACAHGWGAFGWYLREAAPGAAAGHDAFVFVSSAVAGPFLPKYALSRVHWLTPFLRKLDGRAAMVSPTISCARTSAPRPRGATGAPSAPAAAAARQLPHPELGAVALEAAALKLLLDLDASEVAAAAAASDGARAGAGQGAAPAGVFGCYGGRAAAEHGAAAAAAEAVLAAGWSLDCLMLRYQGVDWARDRRHWRCNAGLSPHGDHMYDGATLDPLEVIFVPRTPHLPARRDAAAARAGRLQAWAAAAAAPPAARLAAAAANGHEEAAARALRALRLEAQSMLGAACFDTDFYAVVHPDLARLAGDPVALYSHYEEHGMAEGRRHRWRCDALREALVVGPLQRVVRAMADADPGLAVCDGELGTLWAAAGTLPAVCRAGAQLGPVFEET
ncbi:MAG: hypothetical protein J3K34DRAFT_480939 [Monoraphidium minutum]|nr:MAG: hypothetical protein J3K34DRAFT_480939 [Monoraphidium minutum]